MNVAVFSFKCRGGGWVNVAVFSFKCRGGGGGERRSVLM